MASVHLMSILAIRLLCPSLVHAQNHVLSLDGREGPDSCPDFDHFGSGATALQHMLVQEIGDKVLLLPA